MLTGIPAQSVNINNNAIKTSLAKTMALVSWTGRRTRVFAGVTSTQQVMVALWEVSVKGKLHVTPLVIV